MEKLMKAISVFLIFVGALNIVGVENISATLSTTANLLTKYAPALVYIQLGNRVISGFAFIMVGILFRIAK